MLELNRVLIKLSGEALAGEKSFGFDDEIISDVAKQIKQAVDKKIQVAVVIGAGNFYRGRSSKNIDKTKADQVGMLATIMNAIYVSEVFRTFNIKTQVFTPFEVGAFTTLFSKDEAINALKEGKVIFFAGGTGHPCFSTDTAAALRAIEIDADMILLAKNIDGVYDSDPKTNANAKKYTEIKLQEIIDQKLKVIDLTSAIMCLENNMPMKAFGLNEHNSIINTLEGNCNGTLITL